MRVLIAEDNPASRRDLHGALTQWGYEVVVTQNGTEAWEALRQENAPAVAILDWMMPGIDGVEICRRARSSERSRATYIILLAPKGKKEEIAAGLEAGANDCVTGQFDPHELRARVRVGFRTTELQAALAARVRELEEALKQVSQLQGILPICTYCKDIRTEEACWQAIESYVTDHSEAQFSHSICPNCYEKVVSPEIEKLRRTSL
jgi:sigma-B regulation protein RsbU (phosphoserine phosphatase)